MSCEYCDPVAAIYNDRAEKELDFGLFGKAYLCLSLLPPEKDDEEEEWHLSAYLADKGDAWNFSSVETLGSDELHVNINFCPFCGRRLSGWRDDEQ